jgi:hypothetical protein
MLRCKVTKISNNILPTFIVRNFRLDLLITVLLGAFSPQHDMILFAEPEDRSSSEQMYSADSSWTSN